MRKWKTSKSGAGSIECTASVDNRTLSVYKWKSGKCEWLVSEMMTTAKGEAHNVETAKKEAETAAFSVPSLDALDWLRSLAHFLCNCDKLSNATEVHPEYHEEYCVYRVKALSNGIVL